MKQIVTNKPQIFLLSDKPEYIDVCAAWSVAEWGCHTPDFNLETSLARYKKIALNTKEIPLTWIAFVKNKIVGMITLDTEDHPDRKDLTPWFASFYVHTEFRGKGIGATLAEHLLQEAKNMNYDSLYLFTHTAEALYEKMGFERIGDVRNMSGTEDKPDALMQKKLSS